MLAREYRAQSQEPAHRSCRRDAVSQPAARDAEGRPRDRGSPQGARTRTGALHRMQHRFGRRGVRGRERRVRHAANLGEYRGPGGDRSRAAATRRRAGWA